ncbi:hypothetical protein JL107_09110 [Nakamurella flavida]|uniref:SGNH hydrolase-type esterase domain-containing protein n=1 Tax=Nakamurella flavida TaxID=363630 RepID=A0A938YNR4_9ACTN|nr:GDSL-type esterase/lipase family protein [Nakamurella flavida]MBM9476599.1 hypothetical protein [Nakamurella flavida]MDP9778963.1 lysophospholipase L1-like esterase [Nakamurella flavida]
MTAPRTLPEDERMQLIRYTRPERWPLLDRFAVSGHLAGRILAEVVGEGTREVDRRIDALDGRADTAAARLIADAGYRERLAALPFRADDRVIGLGDSLTADRLGWFGLLTRTLRLADRPVPTVHNLGLSGNTTADAIERFDLVEALAPTHVLIMLGTNDARRHGHGVGHRMVSAGETGRNLSVLRDLITGLGARAVFITPPPGDQTRIDAFFADAALRWSAADLDGVADAVRAVTPEHIDLHRVLHRLPGAAYLDADGVHLSEHGQQLAVVAVVNGLVGAAQVARQG